MNFWAGWAEPCVHMNSVFEALSRMHARKSSNTGESHSVTFLSITAESFPKLMLRYEVSSVPTFIHLSDHHVVSFMEGADAATLTTKTKWLEEADDNTLLGTVCEKLIKRHQVMLFMKGTPQAPQCGFSRELVNLLDQKGVKYGHFDILQDNAVRQALKKHSNWPTYPQLYADGKLIGGLDIIRELADTGTLAEELAAHNISHAANDAAKPAEARSARNLQNGVELSPTQPEVKTDTMGTDKISKQAGMESGQQLDEMLRKRLEQLVSQHRVMLFMKGSPTEPRCGFSKRIVALLNEQGVSYSTFDILKDQSVRAGLKVFANWPTFPQLYANGKLVGGLDIVQQIVEAGALKDELEL